MEKFSYEIIHEFLMSDDGINVSTGSGDSTSNDNYLRVSKL